MAHDKHDGEGGLDRKDAAAMLDRYRVTTGKGFTLGAHATNDLFPSDLEKHGAQALLDAGIARLSALQETLYADGQWSLLVVLQAMDAAGKDSTIKHVLSGVNPQGVSVTSFKAPNTEELAHDFLWRIARALPQRGVIGIFNRSHYEDVLVGRVDPMLLAHSRLPKAVANDPDIWERRLADIVAFERHLTGEGTRIVKIFLDVGLDEQKERLLARLDEPDKTWKFEIGDLKTRQLWPAYQQAYAAAIAASATPEAPWYVVPADRKWFARLVVVEILIAALEGLNLTIPKLSAAERADLAGARAALERD